MRQPTSIRIRAFLWLWFSCAIAAGCNPSHVELEGNVRVDGTPIIQGTIRFAPVDPNGTTAETLIENGRYRAKLAKGGKRVMIHGFKKVGEQFPWGRNGRAMDVLEEIVPSEFNDATTLTIDVVRSRSDADFDLVTKPQK